MNKELEEYLALCQRIYERMVEEGAWKLADPAHGEEPTEPTHLKP